MLQDRSQASHKQLGPRIEEAKTAPKLPKLYFVKTLFSLQSTFGSNLYGASEVPSGIQGQLDAGVSVEPELLSGANEGTTNVVPTLLSREKAFQVLQNQNRAQRVDKLVRHGDRTLHSGHRMQQLITLWLRGQPPGE